LDGYILMGDEDPAMRVESDISIIRDTGNEGMTYSIQDLPTLIELRWDLGYQLIFSETRFS
jgi:hypothetical protein